LFPFDAALFLKCLMGEKLTFSNSSIKTGLHPIWNEIGSLLSLIQLVEAGFVLCAMREVMGFGRECAVAIGEFQRFFQPGEALGRGGCQVAFLLQ